MLRALTGRSVPHQLWHRLTRGRAPGFKLGTRGSAAQTSMVEAWRRQRDDSDGRSSRLISLPSSRSVCSLEKLLTSTTLQKLPKVNSGGTGEGGGWQLAPSFEEISSANNSAEGFYVKNVIMAIMVEGQFPSESSLQQLSGAGCPMTKGFKVQIQLNPVSSCVLGQDTNP